MKYRKPDVELDAQLGALIANLQCCRPVERINLREPILEFGERSVGPLLAAAGEQRDLAASVASWLEVLAGRDRAARTAAVAALRTIAGWPEDRIAKKALERLGASEAPTMKARTTGGRHTAAESEVHARVRKAAREGRLMTYADLETSRGHVGKYLLHLSQEEAAAGHPPITSIIVSKTTMRPGDGYLPAMIEVGYARRGETLDAVWRRAVADVFAFWATQPTPDAGPFERDGGTWTEDDYRLLFGRHPAPGPQPSLDEIDVLSRELGRTPGAVSWQWNDGASYVTGRSASTTSGALKAWLDRTSGSGAYAEANRPVAGEPDRQR